MIPKILHYVWFGDKEFGDLENMCLESWRKYLPDYKIMRWDNSCIEKFDNLYFKQAIENKKYAFASDYARLKALWEYGGIYVDTDEEVLKPLDDFLDHDFFMGCQNCGSAKGLNPALVGATPHNEVIKNLLDVYDDIKFVNDDGTFNLTTNPAYFGKVMHHIYNVKKMFLEEGQIEFHPNSFIYDCYLFGKRNKTSYATHHYAGSWKPSWKIEEKLKFRLFGNNYILKKYKKNHDDAEFEDNEKEKIMFKIRTSKRSFFVLLKKSDKEK